MPDPGTAALIALACAMAALVLVGVFGAATVRQWRRTSRTRHAARALVDVHRAQLDARIDAVADQAEHVAGRAGTLSGEIAQLRADVDHLSWLTSRIPDAREELHDAAKQFVRTARRDGSGRSADEDQR